MPEIVRHRSSYIEETRYDQDAQSLDVTFSDGSQWRYSGVPRDTYAQFVSSPSRGRAFHQLIRDNYEAEEL